MQHVIADKAEEDGTDSGDNDVSSVADLGCRAGRRDGRAPKAPGLRRREEWSAYIA